ncbi:MazG-like family protein [Tianweitania sp. BSSL-BM11]|uniref:MazG-like family protein n=1 Tax=Tianweitania aestuarii TaxID=2814886 RepID=A0ABS5RT32_9HYPH|nr:MazG-like family protein [Tianweitania aestuarii]MBS9720213.1 MazG-like family protein [Tianweitania aestuarii]
MADKPFREMTDEELAAERDRWDQKIKNASGWGAALAVADSFRRNCDRQIERRKRAHPAPGVYSPEQSVTPPMTCPTCSGGPASDYACTCDHATSAEDRAEHFIQAAIDAAPEPMRRLGERLANKLDEEDWKTADRLLTGACVSLTQLKRSHLTIRRLQAAHVERQQEWCPDQKPDLSFRGNEMAGEVGEACNIIKKLERERHGWRGSRATKEQLAEELADVVHTAILCAITTGIDLEPAVVAKFNSTSEKNGLSTLIGLLFETPCVTP